MSPERVQAYRRVIELIDELGPSKLQPDEQDRIRHAADNLIFSRNLAEDGAARESLADVALLCAALVDSGRWETVTATRLENGLSGCGPPPEAELKAA